MAFHFVKQLQILSDFVCVENLTNTGCCAVQMHAVDLMSCNIGLTS